MSILGINNRTENWKTARYFAPLLLDSYARAELAWKLGEPKDTSGSEVKLELFWKGMRDYVDKIGKDRGDLIGPCAEAYEKLFPDLRADIKKFSQQPKNQDSRGGLLEPKEHNYAASNPNGLWDNLRNTEIDIVLETPNKLFIGEAKGEMGLGTNGNYVLVHQLIRQFVMAKILLHVTGHKKVVVPFLVVADGDYTRRTGQVQFMISQEWLEEKNVLTWGDIGSLQPGAGA